MGKEDWGEGCEGVIVRYMTIFGNRTASSINLSLSLSTIC